MSAGSPPSTRIGDTERAEAQRALQIHLGTGRLQVDEFVKRFGHAADAVTAADLASLFADLPAPHPTLPRPPPPRPRCKPVIVGAVAVLALVGLFGFVTGRGTPAPSSSTVATPAPSEPPTSPEALLDIARVRRSSGPGLITLHPSDGVDLDDVTGSMWSVGAGCCGHDVVFAAGADELSVDGGHAEVTGPLGFATCLHATGYTDSPFQRRGLQPGDIICIRTDARRLALITIVSATDQVVEFGATVWDPPVP